MVNTKESKKVKDNSSNHLKKPKDYKKNKKGNNVLLKSCKLIIK